MPLGMRRQRAESSGRQHVRHNELNATMAGFAGQMIQTFVSRAELKSQVDRIIIERRLEGPFRQFWLPAYWTRHYFRRFETWRTGLFKAKAQLAKAEAPGAPSADEQVQQPEERFPGGVDQGRDGDYIPLPNA